jgi:hypothetical protein
LYEK